IPVGIGMPMQIAADDGLWLVPFRHLDRFDIALLAEPGVETYEIDEARALQKQLRHDGVVVVRGRDMTVGAGLRLARALGVRIVRRERLAGETARRDRRLLDVDTFGVRVRRGEHGRRGRAYRRNAAVFRHAVTAELEDI